MFERTLHLLLTGEFICDIRYQDAWHYLDQETHREEVNAFLGKLGRRLAHTRHGGAWFAAYQRIGEQERSGMREHFAEIKRNLRFMVMFFVHVMQAQRQDQFLAPGSLIEVNRLMANIVENPNLTRELQSMASLVKGTASDGTLRGMLDRLIRKLRDDGYLESVNSEREIYAVTGKIEYLQEVIDFLMAHHEIPDEIEEDADADRRQESLL